MTINPKSPRCPVCGQYQHVSSGAMAKESLFRHRITENRDCPKYEECLTEAAYTDAVMVPCITCLTNPRQASSLADQRHEKE